MVENTKPNENDNNSVQDQPAQDVLKVNVNQGKTAAQNPKTVGKKLISAAKSIVESMVYVNSKDNRNSFSELLKFVSSTDDIKDIKHAKRVIKKEYKSIYKQFSGEGPYERVQHMDRLYTLNNSLLDALRKNDKFAALTKLDLKLASAKNKAHVKLEYHTKEAEAEVTRMLKDSLRSEKKLEKKAVKAERYLENYKRQIKETKNKIKSIGKDAENLKKTINDNLNYLKNLRK